MEVLIQERRNSALTDNEGRELKSLTDRAEDHDAQRLACLTALAQLRAVPLRRLIKQLELKPIPHE